MFQFGQAFCRAISLHTHTHMELELLLSCKLFGHTLIFCLHFHVQVFLLAALRSGQEFFGEWKSELPRCVCVILTNIQNRFIGHSRTHQKARLKLW